MKEFSSRSSDLSIFRQPGKALDTSQFGEGASVDRQGDTVYIYDPSGKKRFVVEQYEVPTVGRHGRLALQGQTSGGTWNTLMAGYENKAPDTGETLDSGIVVSSIDLNRRSISISSEPTTPGIQKGYSVRDGGVLVEHSGFGYYGAPDVIAADLGKLNAVAQISADLPPKIDVSATVQKLVDNFQQGIFEPPQFVLPRKAVKDSAKAVSFPAKAKSLFRALKRGN